MAVFSGPENEEDISLIHGNIGGNIIFGFEFRLSSLRRLDDILIGDRTGSRRISIVVGFPFNASLPAPSELANSPTLQEISVKPFLTPVLSLHFPGIL